MSACVVVNLRYEGSWSVMVVSSVFLSLLWSHWKYPVGSSMSTSWFCDVNRNTFWSRKQGLKHKKEDRFDYQRETGFSIIRMGKIQFRILFFASSQMKVNWKLFTSICFSHSSCEWYDWHTCTSVIGETPVASSSGEVPSCSMLCVLWFCKILSPLELSDDRVLSHITSSNWKAKYRTIS